MNNTKSQRWAVLLAEYGAKIEYRQGKNNIIVKKGDQMEIGEGRWTAANAP